MSYLSQMRMPLLARTLGPAVVYCVHGSAYSFETTSQHAGCFRNHSRVCAMPRLLSLVCLVQAQDTFHMRQVSRRDRERTMV